MPENEQISYAEFASPFGRLFAASDSEGLRILYNKPFAATRKLPLEDWQRSEQPFEDLRRQLEEYAEGTRHEFEVLLNPQGTEFQRRVWDALLRIPWGETTNYLALATQLGNPQALRAVGLANGRNPVFILIPCHRVIGRDGSLRGYAGGLEMKQRLLELEGCTITRPRQRGLFS